VSQLDARAWEIRERVVSHMEAWKNLLRAAPRRRLGQEVSRKRATRVFWELAAKLEVLI
jgi:hypothetical protein